MQTEEIASEETVELTADEARELLGIEAERARRELVILPGPVGRSSCCEKLTGEPVSSRKRPPASATRCPSKSSSRSSAIRDQCGP